MDCWCQEHCLALSRQIQVHLLFTNYWGPEILVYHWTKSIIFSGLFLVKVLNWNQTFWKHLLQKKKFSKYTSPIMELLVIKNSTAGIPSFFFVYSSNKHFQSSDKWLWRSPCLGVQLHGRGRHSARGSVAQHIHWHGAVVISKTQGGGNRLALTWGSKWFWDEWAGCGRWRSGRRTARPQGTHSMSTAYRILAQGPWDSGECKGASEEEQRSAEPRSASVHTPQFNLQHLTRQEVCALALCGPECGASVSSSTKWSSDWILQGCCEG